MCAARPESGTVPGRCPACGDEVFVHTDGSGKQVLFDELGPPWPVHPCVQQGTTSEVPQPTTRSRPAADHEPRRDITRCDPRRAGGELLRRKGWVTGVHADRTLASLARPGTLEYERLYRTLGSARFTQFTLIDPEHVSYTLWLPAPHGDISAGTQLQATFRAHEVSGRAFFAVEELQ